MLTLCVIIVVFINIRAHIVAIPTPVLTKTALGSKLLLLKALAVILPVIITVVVLILLPVVIAAIVVIALGEIPRLLIQPPRTARLTVIIRVVGT